MGAPMKNVDIRRQNRVILSRKAWLCLETYRVFVGTWNIYLIGDRQM